ncbi:hypothetical protein BKA82DRAFT_753235 [Pisolithus tinctorius]|uniref:Secreted protein n=1 Tax=Pisolithus tinctorius Marx 270 TaxID=870435 RepID=A0A0C3NZV0_PISTI|nr:hypothetical protein BKA82DRAFT_753235 [Pisolithus tinctorius]KIO00811.1 hypothetical protein M404DRAFT_753235 [Pisolithus tinctorius Marx 270]
MWVSQLLSSLLLFQWLRELVLSGSGQEWPKPESVDFPILASLTPTLLEPAPALAAMVVPNLDHLKCSPPDSRSWAHVFVNASRAFANVRCLCLYGANDRSPSPTTRVVDTKAVCLAFPSVRHVELPASELFAFF